MKTFGYPTSIGRWGFQDQGGCTPLPCLAGRCVSSIPSPRVQTPWNLSPACDAPGPRSVGVHDTSPTGLSQGSSNAQSKGHTHTKHTRPKRWSNRPPNPHYKSLGQLPFPPHRTNRLRVVHQAELCHDLLCGAGPGLIDTPGARSLASVCCVPKAQSLSDGVLPELGGPAVWPTA